VRNPGETKMPFVRFRDHFPKIAEQETRTVNVYDRAATGLPPDDYAFEELFCDEPDCDCRRVFFHVTSSERTDVLAVVAYGWESWDFYAEWSGEEDAEIVTDLKGPTLDLSSPQSDLAPAILRLVKDALHDEGYVEQIRRHYRMFRQRIGQTP